MRKKKPKLNPLYELRERLARWSQQNAQVPGIQVHDYSIRGWGHDYVFRPQDNGLKAHMMGWGYGLKPNDYLILQNKGATTRYQIKNVEYYSDPADMWPADVVFSPREA